MGQRWARGSKKDNKVLSAKEQQGPHRDLQILLTWMHRMHRILQETAGFYCRESANPHRIIARVGFWCRKLSSC